MKKIYFPNLDGLRFFAFLAVFFAHSFWTEFDYLKAVPLYGFIHKYAHKGVLGVNFFFVLSGFLITYLLLAERELTHRIHIKAFYVRRILRIWPLYYLVVAIGFLVVPYVQSRLGQPTPEKGRLLYYLTFVSNFDGPPTSAVLGVLWSIAVEEQFYLVWPVLLSIVPARWYAGVFPALVLLSLCLRPLVPEPLRYTSPFLNMADLAIGGWAAYLAFTSERFRNLFAHLSRPAIAAGYLLGFGLIFFLEPVGTYLGLAVPVSWLSRVVFAVFFAFIILEQNYAEHSFYKLSNAKRISTLGIYTYGLYLLHFLCIYVINKALDIFKLNTKLYQVLVLQTVLCFVASVVVAWLSYQYLEKFFLSLKKRFEYVKTNPSRG